MVMKIVKKRKKSTRFRGTHTHGRGFKKKARGSGHRGGVGMAGTGKRGDQKKTLVTNLYGGDYFGKSKTRRAAPKKIVKIVTLQSILNNLESLEKKGIAKEERGTYSVDLKKYKIIGNTELGIKLKIFANSASKGAQESIKKSGGEIVLA
ncbi:50S ribosomal protein L15 [Candidatus Pacearchaeota archaeon CG10_big_fil_rev_8_21_14_0_10_34_76]|nr:MAG: 50S ribosomal protein L15 [Candidatus Pacearchaeota archaeon CG10_big_fil_rev_8_21_14_0_10_34_76]